MTPERTHIEHDAMEGWQIQFSEATKHSAWRTSTREQKGRILLEIMKNSREDSPKRCVPNNDTDALALAERVIRHYEGPA
jgi:hypothetical protein